MKWRHIRGVFLQEIFVTMHSLEVIVDVFIFPLVNIFIFGLISVYIAGNEQVLAARYVFLGMLLWQVIAITAYSVTVGSMWNIWSRNLSNMFIAPLTIREYVFAQFASGCLKALMLLAIGSFFSVWLFNFNVLEVGLLNLALVFLVFGLFGFALAMVILGIIFRFGTRLAALSWSLPWLFQPLAAAFFPIAELPKALQVVAYALPPSYAFEAARHGLAYHVVDWRLFAAGIILAAAYCVAAVIVFKSFLKRSKEIGQFARNEA
ncbi:MAG: ABC transporter permease [Patescibacteria group bacterium]|nr:ABC transporter permease [bacterium]MDZ4226886.1 ABC transporter permease [Patescibacteria group bacterium]